MGVLLALAACLAWGAADFLGGRASRGLPALLVVLIAQTVGLAMAVVPALLGNLHISLSNVAWCGAAGLCMATAFIAFYRALTVAPMGVVAPLVGTSVVIPVGFGAVQGQWPPAVGVFGLALASLGIVLTLGWRRLGTGRPLPRRVALLSLTAATGFGTGLVLFAHGAGVGSVGAVVVVRIACVMALGCAAASRWRRHPTDLFDGLRRLPLSWVALCGIFDVLGDFGFAAGVGRALLISVAIISGMYPLATAGLARIFTGERLTAQQRWAAGAAVVGAMLIGVG